MKNRKTSLSLSALGAAALVIGLGAQVSIADEHCPLHLQTNSAFNWEQWGQRERLAAKGYQIVGEQKPSDFFNTPLGHRVAHQNIWITKDEKTGKVLCTAQIAIHEKKDSSGSMYQAGNAVFSSNITSNEESSPECGSAFENIMTKLPSCERSN